MVNVWLLPSTDCPEDILSIASIPQKSTYVFNSWFLVLGFTIPLGKRYRDPHRYWMIRFWSKYLNAR